MNRKHEQLPVPCFHDDDELLAPTIACREAPSCGASALPAIEKGVISINILPFEILRQVIVHARDAHLEHVVFQGQFHLTDTLCRGCAYRSLAQVCREWKDIAQELYRRELVVDNRGVAERAVATMSCDPGAGLAVKVFDASMRGRHGVPMSMSDVVSDMSAERQYIADCDRDRELVRAALALCPNLTHFDADFGFHAHLKKPGVLPSSLKNLTLRNVTAPETFQLLAELPNLTNLILRLALDWYADLDDDAQVATCRLNSIEISICCYGETNYASLERLLASSGDTLKHLTLRNKGASSVAAFLPVASQMLSVWGHKLESLTLKDIPRFGRRSKGETPLSWFPPKIDFPRLRTLHLCGSSYSIELFKQISTLRQLTVEDFDEPDATVLLASLETLPALNKLAVSYPYQAPGWDTQRLSIEAWCQSHNVSLLAGWLLKNYQ